MKLDTTKTPSIPYPNWTIEEHTSLGKVDLSKIELYLDAEQQGGKYIQGNKLKEKLKDKPVLNAVVLDYLLKHPRLIPESWKGKWVFFWGTIYRDSSGGLYVRCLCFCDGEWLSRYGWLENGWHDSDPAALCASKPLNSVPFSPLDLEIKLGEKSYKLVEIKTLKK